MKLAECLAFVRDGDVLTVTKPDSAQQAELRPSRPNCRSAGIGTRNPTSKLMQTILAGVAMWEREIMLERQREGIALGSRGDREASRLSPGFSTAVLAGDG